MTNKNSSGRRTRIANIDGKNSLTKKSRPYLQRKCQLNQFPTPEVKEKSITYEGLNKPTSAFNIFVADRLKKPEYCQMDCRVAMVKLRKNWRELPNHKKVKWVRKALQDEELYRLEVEKYCSEHPDFQPEKVKSVLTRAEKELKDSCDGKPKIPPNSGYSLFSRIKLRELKHLPSKSKMRELSRMWKTVSLKDREDFNKQAQIAIAKYKQDFAAYLSNLQDPERVKTINDQKPVNKKKPSTANHVVMETVNENVIELESVHVVRPKKQLTAQQKHSELSKQKVMKLLTSDSTSFSEEKKDKYEKIDEEARKAYNEASISKGNHHEVTNEKKLFIEEPIRPPHGFRLFSSEKMKELTHVDPKKRISEIAKLWKNLATPKKDQYAKRVQDIMSRNNEDLQKILKVKKRAGSDSSDNSSSDEEEDLCSEYNLCSESGSSDDSMSESLMKKKLPLSNSRMKRKKYVQIFLSIK